MKTMLLILALSLGLYSECSAQEYKPGPQTSAFFTELRKSAEEQQKLREHAAASDKAVAALRADLAAPWTSVIISLRHDNSLRDTSFRGFRLSRAGESVTVAAWHEMLDKEETGESRPITK